MHSLVDYSNFTAKEKQLLTIPEWIVTMARLKTFKFYAQRADILSKVKIISWSPKAKPNYLDLHYR